MYIRALRYIGVRLHIEVPPYGSLSTRKDKRPAAICRTCCFVAHCNRIRLYTQGALLPRLPVIFWERCHPDVPLGACRPPDAPTHWELPLPKPPGGFGGRPVRWHGLGIPLRKYTERSPTPHNSYYLYNYPFERRQFLDTY